MLSFTFFESENDRTDMQQVGTQCLGLTPCWCLLLILCPLQQCQYCQSELEVYSFGLSFHQKQSDWIKYSGIFRIRNFEIGFWAFLLKKWLLFVKNHSPVIIAINSSKSTVPDPSSSTSSMICSRLYSSSDVSISRKISFNTSTVIYPFPVTQEKKKIQISRQIFLKRVILSNTSTVVYPFPVTQKKNQIQISR